MNIDYDEYWEEYMMLLCLFKVLKDTGNEFLDFGSEMIVINESDYYFEYCLDALQCAAPIVKKNESLYHKHGYKCSYDDDVDITAYSSKEMQQCFKIARKLDKLEGKCGSDLSNEESLKDKMEQMRGFESYCFDYFIGRKRKGAWLEVLYSCDFSYYIALALWIIRIMQMFKEELPELRKKYNKARRKKKCRSKKGERLYANKR